MKKPQNASQYSSLARYYDHLGERPDFSAYADFVLHNAAEQGIASPLILDLACGTGALTIELALRGLDVIGCDLSPEMLAEASKNAIERGLEPLLICQDMRGLTLAGKADIIVCATDSLNYLTAKGDLEATLAAVARNLYEGGLFIFDLNTRYTFENVYGERDYVLESEGVLCAWRNYYNPTSKSCNFELDIFEELPNGFYKRHTEQQKERYFPQSTVKKLLAEAGFEPLGISSDFNGGRVESDTPREYYVCKLRGTLLR